MKNIYFHTNKEIHKELLVEILAYLIIVIKNNQMEVNFNIGRNLRTSWPQMFMKVFPIFLATHDEMRGLLHSILCHLL